MAAQPGVNVWDDSRDEEGFITIYVCIRVCMVIKYSKSMDQPGKVANPARGQLNRENGYFPVRVRA